ncbi:hypothetical protein VFPPC_16038 [Pochonia chlamydosporia 170]|uniref:Uncharacterized protein n=1 Tax=Pochonia chlamydosporia 170 TaxID=1380566 RepID=A0A179FMI0_METCM|nr:hypothetical protein VFPPC_16038 [Pochonia chlamydosporia 170]OAQ66498.1 hypothetical protein VFPPC_16038 [Pochonia chlamydosporia 170]
MGSRHVHKSVAHGPRLDKSDKRQKRAAGEKKEINIVMRCAEFSLSRLEPFSCAIPHCMFLILETRRFCREMWVRGCSIKSGWQVPYLARPLDLAESPMSP